MPKFQYIRISRYLKLGRLWIHLTGPKVNAIPSQVAAAPWGIHEVTSLNPECYDA